MVDKKARISMEKVYRDHKHVEQGPQDLESNFPERFKIGNFTIFFDLLSFVLPEWMMPIQLQTHWSRELHEQ